MQNKAKVDILVDDFKDFNFAWEVSNLPIICVYYNPSDYPGKYVARVFDVTVASKYVVVKDTLEEIRKAIPKNRFKRFVRRDNDDPVIVETYI